MTNASIQKLLNDIIKKYGKEMNVSSKDLETIANKIKEVHKITYPITDVEMLSVTLEGYGYDFSLLEMNESKQIKSYSQWCSEQ